MFKKLCSVILCVAMLIGLLPTISLAADTTIYIGAEDFGKNVGTWVQASRDAGSTLPILRAGGGGRPQNSKTATIYIDLPSDGEYTVWARVRDYKAGVDKDGKPISSGDRLCKVQVNGTLLPNDLGNHGKDSFEWQEAGKITLKKGETKIELVDTTANYARVEAVALSTNASLKLASDSSLENMLIKYGAKIIEKEVASADKEEDIVVNKNLPSGEKPSSVKTYFVGAGSFANQLGTWTSPGSGDNSKMAILRSPGGQKPESTENAITSFDAAVDGTYFVWAWTRDYADGVRTYKLAVDGKLTERTLGAHGLDGWAWEYCGELELKKGTVQVELVDSGNNYGRFQGAVITNDPTLIPNDLGSNIGTPVKATKGKHESNITGTVADPNAPTADEELLTDGHTYIVATPDDFSEENLGSWKLSNVPMGSIFSNIIMSASDGKGHNADPATLKIVAPKTGIYKLFVHSNDAAANSGRRFTVEVGSTGSKEFGAHGQGWGWENTTIPLVAGENTVKITDTTGNYGRWDMFVITTNLEFEPPTTNLKLKGLATLAESRPTEFKTEPDPARPSDEIAVNLNGTYMKYDVPPVLINDRTMVPFRAIFEALGCTVSWDDETQTASGSRNGKTIKLVIDSTEAKVGDDKFTLDSPATLVNSRTLVPLRFISESLGAKVAWDDATQTVWMYAEIPPQMIMLTPESYYDTGTWDLEGISAGSFDCGSMRGAVPADNQATPEDGKPEETLPAKANIEVVKDGEYKVFAHSRDYTSSYTSKRTFAIRIDGKQIGGNMGTHGNNGFSWQEAGTVTLSKGKHVLELVDTSGFYARCDMVLLTDDLSYIPSTSYSELASMAYPVRASSVETAEYPKYAKELGNITDQVTLGNDKIKVNFYKVNTSNGQVIQNEILNNVNGEWIKTNNRDEELGHLVVSADKASLGKNPQDRYVYESSYTVNGQQSAYMGIELLKAGNSTWFIPTDYEVNADGSVKLISTNDLGTIVAHWELPEGTKAPKVTLSATFNKDGYYTIGSSEGDELTYDEFDFALAPFRVQSKRVDKEVSVYSEQYLFTPMGCYTLPVNNPYSTQKVTKGVVVDPEFTTLKWVKRADADYGIAMKGADNGYHGVVYAPILGSDSSKLDAGETFTYQYRIISNVSDWYDNYKFIVADLYDVDSYRQNTFSTLNQAIFNTRNYSLDDYNAGWDPLDKAYWNIESRNTTAVADPMEALQIYLLSEDETYLEKRSLPTLANLMTRGTLQFNSKGGLSKSNGYVDINKIPYPIGEFINIMNMNVRGGMYELTRGRVPYLLEKGIENTLAGKNVNGYNSMTPFSDDMYLYQYTGEKKYLDSAIRKADAYLADTVYAPQTTQIAFADFIYTKYFPNLPALMDMYEISGEERYLDAAYETAKMILTSLWVPGVDGAKKDTEILVKNEPKQTKLTVHDWWGDTQRLVGLEDTSDKSETLPHWVVSRVGLGLEQASTFYGNQSSTNIIMNMWIGDVLKIATYKNDEFLANAAENAIVGRFSNYSGYYYGYTGFASIQMKENYPYEGPDLTAIYPHHIPPFMAMLEDFIINQTFYRSGGKVNFPSVRQSGYAYFYSNHYGFDAGNVYDLSDMWLWLAEGVLDSGNLQIDWLGARKDGMVAFMMMNQSKEDVTTTATLGEKVGAVTGTATLYDADGNKSEVQVTDGKFTVTVPAKGMVTVAINAPDVKKPGFADFDYTLEGTDVETGSTYFDHGNGKAIALQMNSDAYYAYVYVTDKPASVKEVTVNYTVGDKKLSATTDKYPYEFIIKVDDPTEAFTYTIDLTKTDGTKSTVKGGTIKPLK